MKLIPKNWDRFQHYKDRCPPWIKLHRDLLNDRHFISLPTASKALAPLLWLLASECKDGTFDATTEELVFRLRMDRKEIEQGLSALIDNGFFLDASTMLAPSLRVATPETETERETETGKRVSKSAKKDPTLGFDLFWIAYPNKKGKGQALKAWSKISPDKKLLQSMLSALDAQKQSDSWVKDEGRFIPHPATWLNGMRWEDEVGGASAAPASRAAQIQEAERKEAERRAVVVPTGPTMLEVMKSRQGVAA